MKPMKNYYVWLFLFILLPLKGVAQQQRKLSLPRLEQLSSQRVTQVIQDAEGFLWYATEGGGVCRDDGYQIMVFRSDAEHPDLLGSNNVASIAEADSMHIIIGTYHGAYLLDKQDYSIRRLTEVDDKRVDDIIISRDGHWWLTSNKKIYEYDGGKLLKTYRLGDKYIFRLREDSLGQIWAREWEGGQFRLEKERFVPVTTEWPDSIDFSRVTTDRQGRLLVADGWGKCYALEKPEGLRCFPIDGDALFTKSMADSIRNSLHLSARPTAIATDDKRNLWFSTGKDIRRHCQDGEQIVLPDTKDVSAMTFSDDGTLWLATIFGTVMTYCNGQLSTDDYASNEYGDAIVALQTDSAGRLVIVCDRYVRLYAPAKKTLRQQNIEDDGVYRIELQETQPNERWSQPPVGKDMEHLPRWVWWSLGVLVILLLSLIGYIWFMARQRKRFIQMNVKSEDPVKDEWLQSAIAAVENHIGDEHYNVEQLSGEMCMSRMTFYRKIQAATGQKPTEFIRTIRLRRAAELLREGRMSITEVSYATGFSSVSYFSRCFRTMYGMPPTQYMDMLSQLS
jgi:AraC-like DNA-binding protein/sugar lactone lactonase YvrE